jgi:hypothetical protein
MRPGTPRSLLWIATDLAACDVRLAADRGYPIKHPPGLVEGAKNTAVFQGLIDDLIAASSTPSYAAQRAFVR